MRRQSIGVVFLTHSICRKQYTALQKSTPARQPEGNKLFFSNEITVRTFLAQKKLILSEKRSVIELYL